jgi:hypothetical protein
VVFVCTKGGKKKMKKIIILCSALFATAAIAHTIDWYVDGQIYQTTSCESGDNITPPTPPAKYGYTFREWQSSYTLLEYIESTGTQYINTGISASDIGNNNPWVEATFSMEQTGDIDWFGESISANGIIWNISVSSSTYQASNAYPRWGSTNSLAAYMTYADGKSIADLGFYQNIRTLRIEGLSPARVYIDGVLIATISGVSLSMIDTNKIFLFKGRSSANAAKWTSFRAGNATGAIVDLVAAKRLSDSVLGMYDKVSGTFKTNQGSGDFIPGPFVR